MLPSGLLFRTLHLDSAEERERERDIHIYNVYIVELFVAKARAGGRRGHR